MSKTGNKTKAVVSIGYHNYVMDIEDAVQLIEIMSRAEMYNEIWRKAEEGGTTYHIWDQDPKSLKAFTIIPLSNVLYDMYKLAGEPSKAGE
jgi:hypothetical protein